MCVSGSWRGDRKPHFPLLIFVMPEADARWVLPLQLEFGEDVSQALLIFTSNSCKNQVSSWGNKLAQICFRVWPRFSEWLTLSKVHPSSWLKHNMGSVVKEQIPPYNCSLQIRGLRNKIWWLVSSPSFLLPNIKDGDGRRAWFLNPKSQCGFLHAKQAASVREALLEAVLGGGAVGEPLVTGSGVLLQGHME